MLSSTPALIGLASPAPGCGKSTAAEHLVKAHDFMVLPFAGPLKAVMIEFLAVCGYDPEEAYHYVYGDKAAPLELVPGRLCARQLLQTLGTEWGRSCVHPDLWITLWARSVQEAFSLGQRVVVDDVRFLNEVRAVRDLGGKIISIRRTEAESAASADVLAHASEGLFSPESGLVPDWQIANNGTLDGLAGALNVALENLHRTRSPASA